MPILRDRTFNKLFTESMVPLRNQAVFHFFEDAIRKPLAAFDPRDYTVVAGAGRQQKQVFYELSDLLAFDLFIGTRGSTQEENRRAMALMDQTLDLLKKVVQASASLIAEYCKSEGLVLKSRSREGSGGT